jgi:poly-gamma-glutamate capsule biosynthesis protein CapA/YwtB (metallophosphatase superfamily)
VVSRRVRRRRRQVTTFGVLLFVVLFYVVFLGGSGKKGPSTPPPHSATHAQSHRQLAFPTHSPLNPDWRGDGKEVTFGFAGDVHFAGAVGSRLAQDPATALGDTISQLFAGTQLRMVNLETAVTDNAVCPQPQDKPFIFDAPTTAITALQSASITLATQANDHAMDCGAVGLGQDITAAAQASFPIIGVGHNAAQAFAPYRKTISGQRIAIFAATQIIGSNLVSTWTATSSQAGVASALNPTELVRAVQAARRSADTVIVYLHWGTEVATCPNPQQEPLAEELVKAGADIVIGTNAHVLQGAGYLGSAYVDYGLGNFAFYDDTPPETDSGALIITAIGRHIESVAWRPANILAGLPQPLIGTPATAAVQSWQAARSCTNLAATPSTSMASENNETIPFVPPTTTTTTTTPPSATTTTTGSGSTSGTTSTTTSSTSSTTTTTAPTDNAG